MGKSANYWSLKFLLLKMIFEQKNNQMMIRLFHWNPDVFKESLSAAHCVKAALNIEYYWFGLFIDEKLLFFH